MRSVSLAFLAVLCGLIAGCQTTANSYRVTRDTVGRAGVSVRDGLGDAVTAPLEDLGSYGGASCSTTQKLTA